MSQAPITLPLQPTTDDLAHFDVAGGFKCSRHLLDPADPIRHRQIIERAIIRRACEDLLAAGFLLSHHDGEAWTVKDSADLSTIMCNIQAADEERIVVRPGAGVDGITPASGAIFLVYGNDGWDVIADHSGWLERYLVGATELSDAIADAIPLTPEQLAHINFINSQRASA